MNAVVVACIISAIIILIYAIQVYYAYANKVLMFSPYVVETGSQYAIYNADPTTLDSDQITQRRSVASSTCNTLANMKNPVSIYCSQASTSSGIDCSNI